MKHTTLKGIILILTVLAVLSWKKFADHSEAKANQVQGISIFTDCKPTADYEYIATIKPNVVQMGTNTSGQSGLSVCELTYTQLRDNLIKIMKKKHKEGTGLILYPESNSGDVIKFKE